TLAPDSFQAGIKRVGSPAPVVMTATFSSAAMAASCSTWGCMSMMFTPKGLSVRERQRRMLSWNTSGGMPPAPMRPRAPALDTAAANSAVAMLAIPPWIKGNSIPSHSFSFCMLFLLLILPLEQGPPPGHSGANTTTHHPLAPLQQPLLRHLVQRDGDGTRGCISIALNVLIALAQRHLQTPGHRLHNAVVGLMEHVPVHLLLLHAGLGQQGPGRLGDGLQGELEDLLA